MRCTISAHILVYNVLSLLTCVVRTVYTYYINFLYANKIYIYVIVYYIYIMCTLPLVKTALRSYAIESYKNYIRIYAYHISALFLCWRSYSLKKTIIIIIKSKFQQFRFTYIDRFIFNMFS